MKKLTKEQVKKEAKNLLGTKLAIIKNDVLPDPKSPLSPAMDPVFNEILFKLWMSGRSMPAIVEMFSGTARGLSDSTLRRIREHYKWNERKARIIKELQQEVDSEIKLARRKQLQLINMAVDMNLKVVESEYVEFMRDPKAYIEAYRATHKQLPPWLALKSNEMLELFKSHKYATTEGIVDEKNGDKSTFSLKPEEETVIWQIIRNAATRKALPAPIEIEAKIEDVNGSTE